MLRFITAVLILIVLLRISRYNVYLGPIIYLFFSISFIIYAINTVDSDDIKYRRKMLSTPEGRKTYYMMINSQ